VLICFTDEFKQVVAVSNKSSLILLSASKQNAITARSFCSNMSGNLPAFTEEKINRLYPVLEEIYLKDSKLCLSYVVDCRCLRKGFISENIKLEKN